MEMILEDRRIPAPHDHGLGELLAVKMAIILITTYQFNETPIKIPIPLFTEIGKSILKFIGKHRKLWNVKATLRQKKVNVRGITLPNFFFFFHLTKFQLFYRAFARERSWC